MGTKLVSTYSSELSKIGSPDLIKAIADIELMPPEEAFEGEFKAQKTICFGGDDLESIVSLVVEGGVRHYVQNRNPQYLFNLLKSSLIMTRPSAALNNPVSLFLPNFDREQQAEYDIPSQAIEFRSTSEKSDILFAIEHYFKERKHLKGLRKKAILIADELITNALYHGPVDFKGVPLFKDRPRSSHFSYPPHHQASEIILANDGKYLLIGCRDNFGSLTEKILMDTLGKAYNLYDTHDVKAGSSAGLGFKMIIDTCQSFFAMVHQGKQTLVCGLMPLGVGYKEIENLPKDLHITFVKAQK